MYAIAKQCAQPRTLRFFRWVLCGLLLQHIILLTFQESTARKGLIQRCGKLWHALNDGERSAGHKKGKKEKLIGGTSDIEIVHVCLGMSCNSMGARLNHLPSRAD